MTATITSMQKLPLHDLAKSRAPWLGYQFFEPDKRGPQPDPWSAMFALAEADLQKEMMMSFIFRLHPEAYDIIGQPFVRVGLNPQPLPPKVRLPQLLAQRLISVINNSLLQANVTGNGKEAQAFWTKWLSGIVDICPVPPKKGPWPKKYLNILLTDMEYEMTDFIIAFAAALQLELHHQPDAPLIKEIHTGAEKILNTMAMM